MQNKTYHLNCQCYYIKVSRWQRLKNWLSKQDRWTIIAAGWCAGIWIYVLVEGITS